MNERNVIAVDLAKQVFQVALLNRQDKLLSNKAMSSGLQLADLVARPIGLNVLRPDQENRAFDILKRKFYCDGGRDHVGTGYEGLGMKIYPSSESEKPR